MLFDAHNHLHSTRLDPWRSGVVPELVAMGVCGAVVNGTRESDWEAVAVMAKELRWVKPSFGLHPWHVNERSPGWKDSLLAQVSAHPGCGIGEIGLDRWVEGHDVAAQSECFRWQLELAAKENLPATVHCLKAWGLLAEIVASCRLPERGFLIHAYGGPLEMVKGFASAGAYFSFSPYFMQPRKAQQRETFRAIPPDRLLVETDAPDMAPPIDCNPRPLREAGGTLVNHPANIALAYDGLAELRGWTRVETEQRVAENFERLFGQTIQAKA